MTTKKELIDGVASASGVTKAVAEKVIDALSDHINVEVRSGREVLVPALGKFSRKQRDARTGRNPATGDTIQIAARRVPHFKPAKAFSDAVA